MDSGISKQELQVLLNAMQEKHTQQIKEIVAEMKKLNPLEQEAYDEQMKRKNRRGEMMVELGRIEQAAAHRRKYGCSHQRYPASSGKLAGHSAPAGQGEWTTGGQAHSAGLISLICTRCANIWIWRATGEEIQLTQDQGLNGFPPPQEARCLTECCPTCHKMFTKDEIKEHDIEACKLRRKKAMQDAGLVLA